MDNSIDMTLRIVADTCNMTKDEFKKYLQCELNYAFTKKQRNAETIEFQNQIPRKGKIPTVEEFIEFVNSVYERDI